MKHVYPVTIIAARYQGVYEGGKYVAWNKYPDQIPHEATADDSACATYFSIVRQENLPVGVGDTPTAAYYNLIQKLVIVE